MRTAAIWREFAYLFYNKTISEILKQYGNTTISQLNCLSCRLAMYVMTIILSKKMDIQLVVDGARKSQLFAIEQDALLEKFQKFFDKYNLKIDFPLKDLQDDFELKNQLLIRNFVPKTLEPQCLLGMPLSSKEMTQEIIDATTNVFEELLLPKAYELIDKYKNIDILGEYL